MKIKKGDTVKVLTGKDAGRQGAIVKILPVERMVVVDGVNIYKKHMKGDGREKKSAIIEIAKPLDISNVMLICPSCEKASRVGYVMEGKKKVRICKKCKENIDKKAGAKDESSKGKGKKDKKGKSAKKKTSKKSGSKKESKPKKAATKEKTVTKSKSSSTKK